MSCQHSQSFRFLTAAACALALSFPAMAASVDSDQVYCFSESDFGDDTLSGICVTALPDERQGKLLLGSRVILPGDVLTAEQVSRMTFSPALSEESSEAPVSYLPIYSDRVDPESVMTISIHGKEDKAPIAEDSALETYKNLPNNGKLKASDPEQQALTFTLTRQPRRGNVEIREDGSFTYTPKHNKVGTDSFTYTAADPAGNVSREATVTVEILKPTDSRQYTDTQGLDCRFTAEWLRSTGIFSGETISGQSCFSPDASVSRGEFLSMLMQVLDLPVDRSTAYTGFVDECESWLKPYLAAALRCGIISGYPTAQGAEFRAGQPITGSEAAVMLKNALDLAVPTSATIDETLPAWAADACAAVSASGFEVNVSETVTRADAAQLLYQVSKLAQSKDIPLFTNQPNV